VLGAAYLCALATIAVRVQLTLQARLQSAAESHAIDTAAVVREG